MTSQARRDAVRKAAKQSARNRRERMLADRANARRRILRALQAGPLTAGALGLIVADGAGGPLPEAAFASARRELVVENLIRYLPDTRAFELTTPGETPA